MTKQCGGGGGGLVTKSCSTLVTPWTVARQAPLSMAFSGKNTGVGCHSLLQGSNPGLPHCRRTFYHLSHQGSPVCYKGYESESEVAQSCPTLCDPMDCSLQGSSLHGILQARILGVGCHFLLQGIFPTQGLNLGLLHSKQTL